MSAHADRLADISRWVDDNVPQQTVDGLTWGRVAKVGEEFGEVIEAMIGWTGQNPRKGVTHTRQDVIDELLDTAAAALAAVEHLTSNSGQASPLLRIKVRGVHRRAGLE